MAVPEDPQKDTGAGLAPTGEGWFVLNARDARWRRREGRGYSVAFTGSTDEECESQFPQVGVNLFILGPGEPIGMYHREADQEDFLILAGEALLLIEGEERLLRQWDFVHCPPDTEHMIVGAGEGPCTLVAIGAREHMSSTEWGEYTVSELAQRHDAGVEQATSDPDVAYARFPTSDLTHYPGGLLPGDDRTEGRSSTPEHRA